MSPVCNLKTESLTEYFKQQVTQAIQNQKVTLSSEAEFYLVNLLTTYSKTDKLYSQNKNGEILDQPLALQLFDALLASPQSKIPILKKMGDFALYISGFFTASLLTKLINLDYYIQMGHTAYSSISQLVPADGRQKSLKELFDELALNFVLLVDILSEVADSTSLRSDQDLLKLYERWLQTGSERIKNLLFEQGIIPHVQAKTGYIQ